MENKENEVNYEEVALSLAKDLVELSQIVRKILSNSTFNYSVIDDVKLVELMTRDIINTYVENNKEEDSETENA